MALETGDYIDDLNQSYPVGVSDTMDTVDGHLQLIKKCVKQSFPNITGPMTCTQVELNVLDGITATTAELNILDGVTSTAAELNILDGVTSTAAELNILDGVTSTAAELNKLDGFTGVVADLNVIAGANAAGITPTELGYLNGVTSAIQTQIDAKQATITGAATTIDDTDLTASRALISNVSGKVAVHGTVSDTELGYLNGVTSGIQAQIDAAGASAASQAQQEAATDNTVMVTPANQELHPSACKAWGMVAVSGAPSLTVGYNVTSVADVANGVTTINLTTAFSSANYVVVAIPVTPGSALAASATVSNQAAGSFRISTVLEGIGSYADMNFYFACYGDQ